MTEMLLHGNRGGLELNPFAPVLRTLSPDGLLPEIIEYDDHPWFIACNFTPSWNRRHSRRTRCSRPSWARRWSKAGWC